MKWIKALNELTNGNDPACPKCGEKSLDYGYVLIDTKKRLGYGAVWCEKCRLCKLISRVDLNDLKNDEKIIRELPKDLKFD